MRNIKKTTYEPNVKYIKTNIKISFLVLYALKTYYYKLKDAVI